MDVLLQKFFEIHRWEEALELGVAKGIDKGELRALTSPQVRIKLYNAIADNNFSFRRRMAEIYGE